nr:phosphatidylinositol 4-kinase alpha 1-like [Ipomoea trifida]
MLLTMLYPKQFQQLQPLEAEVQAFLWLGWDDISTLIEKFDIPVPTSPRDAASNGSSGVWKSNMDLLAANMGYNDDGAGAGAHRQAITAFEEEAVESLEKREMAFKLIGHIMDRVTIDAALLEQVRGIARDQLHSMVSFLKIKTLSYLDSDAKSSKRLLHGALALLVEAAEACLLSMWRKLRACEELFSTLLFGISQAAAARSGQLLRVLLIRFKPLVLATCARGDTWSSSQGAMFESVLKTSCEIIELGWQKDRSPIETFIMGLATSIRERNDYGEEIEVGLRNNLLSIDYSFQAHPWFKGIEWDKLYQMKAAFIPEVNDDELDTQNFEKFEETDNQVPTATKSGPWRKGPLFFLLIIIHAELFKLSSLAGFENKLHQNSFTEFNFKALKLVVNVNHMRDVFIHGLTYVMPFGMEGLILGAMLILRKLSSNRFDLSHVSHNLLSASELAAVGSTGLS